jgi:hypothetical protein
MSATEALLPDPLDPGVLPTSPNLTLTAMAVSHRMAEDRRAREVTGVEAVAMTAATTALPTGE